MPNLKTKINGHINTNENQPRMTELAAVPENKNAP